MRRIWTSVRRGGLAALLTLAGVANAEIAATTTQSGDRIIVTGLSPDDRADLTRNAARVTLQVAGQTSQRGMPLTLAADGAVLEITPRFALRAGIEYVLGLNIESGAIRLALSQPHADLSVPRLTGFAPSQPVIPANTLRLYLTFSEPMARGNLRGKVTLERADGTRVPDPFLSLGPELWSANQTRATLLFDPGRIKQGVGPNVSHGAPLQNGNGYRLMISKDLRSAAGVPLGVDVTLTFRAGPPVVSPVDPLAWDVLVPKRKTRMPLTLGYDRIMDSAAAHQRITLHDPDGQQVKGRIFSDGGGWSLVPDHPWRAGQYSLTVDPTLEDISGNAVGLAFDAPAGTIATPQDPVFLGFRFNP